MAGVLDGSEASLITLRPFDFNDADDVMAWASDSRVAEFCLWDAHTSRDDSLAFIRDFAIPHPWCQAICLAGRPIGSISVSIGSGVHDGCRGEIGYVVARPYWGKGIATSAVAMAVAAGFQQFPGLVRIHGMVDSDNTASQRVLEKSGFVREGVLRKYMALKGRVRDVVVYSILEEDIMRE